MRRIGLILVLILLVSILSACNSAITQGKIISIRSTEFTTGSFFLGTGTLGEETYYFTYMQTSDGGYKLVRVPTNVTTIFEDATVDTAYIKIDASWGYEVEIHVPKGTIVREFKLE